VNILLIRKRSRLTYKLLISLSLISLSFSPSPSWAGFFDNKTSGFSSSSAEGFLPVEEAFRLEGALKASTLTLTWEIEPAHYLYRSRFKVRSLVPENAELIPVSIPNGEKVDDEFQGRVEILRDKVQLIYQFDLRDSELKEGVVVEVIFQGCAEAGLCYPPHRQQLNLIQR